jgi:putative hydrolase of the HAD superfamily
MALMAVDASHETGRTPPPRAVLLDALGTLVDLDDPVGNLTVALADRGLDVPPQEVGVALRAEIAYYREHHDEAVDEPSLERLRDRCAEVFRAGLSGPARDSDPARLREALLAGLRFRAFDEVPGVLRALRERGTRLVVVSNWDVSLHGVLRDTGLAGLLEGVLTSAEERISKPDPRIFERALALAGDVPPEETWHVGDDLVADVGGATAAGITPVLVDRDGSAGPAPGARTVRTLAELLPGGR